MNKYFFSLLLPFCCLAQVPAYYNSVDFSKTGNALKTQLTTLITSTHTHELVYTPEVWSALEQADLDPENTNNVFLIYGYNDSDTNTDNDKTRDKNDNCHTSSCDGLWVREHVFPRSLGTPNLEFEGPGSDAHHLRAIDYNMNNSRGNNKYADGSGNAKVISGGYFYPGDEWKGDIARMIMYMYVRYTTRCQALIVGSGAATYSPEMPDVFLKWNAEDPVSQYELNRNTVLQNMQGNRNPFIDNPYLATRIWNGSQAEDRWNLLSSEDHLLPITSVYPTLTTGIVNILGNEQKAAFSIYNNIGQQINARTTSNTVDLTGNPPGLYYLTISGQHTNQSFKIIKQ